MIKEPNSGRRRLQPVINENEMNTNERNLKVAATKRADIKYATTN